MATISKERMIEIEKIAGRVLEGQDFEYSPSVDIVSIVKKKGFEVQPSKMPIDTTGCLLVNDDPKDFKRLIVVNREFKNPDNEDDVVFKKSRFITAHEFGHYMLHKPIDAPLYAHRDSDKRDKPEELEADYFARSLLMPLEVFKSYYELLNEFGNNDRIFTLEMLSKVFKVTKDKAKKRIGDLELICENQ